jgi:Ca2+-binding RTX toxin-like protein
MTTPTKWGAEFLVNTTTASLQYQPSVTVLAGGRFVVVWSDYSRSGGDTAETAVRGQIYNADGSRFGGEFLVNTITPGFQLGPDVEPLANGGFVVTWNSFNVGGDASGTAVSAQVFNANGGRIGGEFLVNTTINGSQEQPQAAAFNDGRVVIVWHDFSGVGDSSGGAIRAQLFTASGTKSGSEFLVNSTTANPQYEPVVTVLDSGNFVVAWRDDSATGGDTSGSAIRARMFSSGGVPFGPDFVVNTTVQGDQGNPAIVALAGGGFVVTWEDFSQTGPDTSSYAVRAQMFNADATRAGNEFVIHTATAGAQTEPAVTAFRSPFDGFVAVWQTAVGPDDTEIHAQQFDLYGAKVGHEFIVGSETLGFQATPAIAMLRDGRFVVAFADTSGKLGDTSDSAIAAQIFDPNRVTVQFYGTALDEQVVGTANSDLMSGAGGNDWLIGYDGDDTFTGGAGADRIDGGAGVDSASYYSSAAGVIANLDGASLFGEAAGDVLIGIEVVYGSAFRDILIGDAHDNILVGMLGNDTLDGGAGNDMLIAGEGVNELIGREGYDTATFELDLADHSGFDLGQRIEIFSSGSSATMTGIEHLQFRDGSIIVDDGNPVFDQFYYARNNLDVYHAGMDSLAHYNAFGWHEGRDPNFRFDTKGYLAINREVAKAGVNPLDHYHAVGWQEGRDPSAGFDTTLYLINNPDIAAAHIDPLAHYLASGLAEGRVAYDAVGAHIVNGFDAQYYLFHNPDVAAAGVDPLMHFNTDGWREGRDPSGWFDTAGYLANYADVAAAGINPLQHYQQHGWREGRDPSSYFDTKGYLIDNPDVAAAHINPLNHFLQFGIYEGRQAVNDGVWT